MEAQPIHGVEVEGVFPAGPYLCTECKTEIPADQQTVTGFVYDGWVVLLCSEACHLAWKEHPHGE